MSVPPPSLSIYVAGKFTDKEGVRKIQQLVVNRIPNAHITYDWTVHESALNDDILLEEKQRCANADRAGVLDASAVVAVMTDPTYAYQGTWCELGIALGHDIPVYIYAPDATANALMNVFVYTTENAISDTTGSASVPLVRVFTSIDSLLAALSSLEA